VQEGKAGNACPTDWDCLAWPGGGESPSVRVWNKQKAKKGGNTQSVANGCYGAAFLRAGLIREAKATKRSRLSAAIQQNAGGNVSKNYLIEGNNEMERIAEP